MAVIFGIEFKEDSEKYGTFPKIEKVEIDTGLELFGRKIVENGTHNTGRVKCYDVKGDSGLCISITKTHYADSISGDRFDVHFISKEGRSVYFQTYRSLEQMQRYLHEDIIKEKEKNDAFGKFVVEFWRNKDKSLNGIIREPFTFVKRNRININSFIRPWNDMTADAIRDLAERFEENESNVAMVLLDHEFNVSDRRGTQEWFELIQKNDCYDISVYRDEIDVNTIKFTISGEDGSKEEYKFHAECHRDEVNPRFLSWILNKMEDIKVIDEIFGGLVMAFEDGKYRLTLS